jgi:hypothetical protein
LVVVDAAEELAEELLAAGLVVRGGVVVLGLQGGPELDAGLEVAAGFADRFEGAVQLGWPCAIAVAEEAVVLAAQAAAVGGGITPSSRRLLLP